MDLQSFFYVTQGIAAILISILSVVFIFMVISVLISTRKIRNKIQRVADESISVAEEAREYTGKVGKAALDYLIIKAFNSIKKNKERS